MRKLKCISKDTLQVVGKLALPGFVGLTVLPFSAVAQPVGSPIFSAPVPNSQIENRQPVYRGVTAPAPIPQSGVVAPSVVAPEIENSYLLGAGDRVRLDVFSASEYSGEYQVLSDGTLNIPLIGAVSVQGMTVRQASQFLSSKFAAYLRQPIITISLLVARPVKVVVTGEVQRPGAYTASPIGATTTTGNTVNSTNTTIIPTVTRMIQQAGGIKQTADIRNVEIHRAQPRLAGVKEQLVVEKVDLWQLLQTGDSSQDLLLKDGDSIVIPTATALTPGEITELATASFSPAQITVSVIGEVGSPGAVQVPPSTPLNQALLAAGGFTRRAKTKSVEFIRLNPDGTVSKRTIPVNLAQGLDERSNPPLRSNDIIVVNRSGLANLSDTLSFLNPVSGVLGILNILGR